MIESSRIYSIFLTNWHRPDVDWLIQLTIFTRVFALHSMRISKNNFIKNKCVRLFIKLRNRNKLYNDLKIKFKSNQKRYDKYSVFDQWRHLRFIKKSYVKKMLSCLTLRKFWTREDEQMSQTFPHLIDRLLILFPLPF